jgi:hypothetical protein
MVSECAEKVNGTALEASDVALVATRVNRGEGMAKPTRSGLLVQDLSPLHDDQLMKDGKKKTSNPKYANTHTHTHTHTIHSNAETVLFDMK